MKQITLLFPLILPLAIGCGNVPEAKDFNESLVAARRAFCSCDGYKLLYSSEQECQSEFPPSEAQQACVETLFKNLNADFGGNLECLTSVNYNYATCLNSRTCSDLERFKCLPEWSDQQEDCPKFPDDVQRDLDDCLD